MNIFFLFILCLLFFLLFLYNYVLVVFCVCAFLFTINYSFYKYYINYNYKLVVRVMNFHGNSIHLHQNFFSDIVTLIVIASVGGVYLVTACRQRNYLKRMKKNAKSSSPHIIRYSSKSKGAPYAKMLTEVDADEEDDDIEMMPGITKR